MDVTSPDFKINARRALDNEVLQKAMLYAKPRFIDKRAGRL